MSDTPGYHGRTYDEALDQQTRIRRCKCNAKRVTVEVDAGVLSELRRKAFICDTFDLEKDTKARVKEKKEERRNGWSDKEKELLRTYFPTMGSSMFRLLNNRTKKACDSKAARMGLVHGKKKPRAQKEVADPIGFIPGGRAASVFDLASAGGGA